MKLSQDLVGKVVAIQLGRPLMMFEYGGHLKRPDSSDELLIGKPITRDAADDAAALHEGRPARQVAVTMDFVMGVRITAVGDDWLRYEIVDPDQSGTTGNTAEVTIPSLLALQVVEITGFEVPMPEVTAKIRTPSKLIL